MSTNTRYASAIDRFFTHKNARTNALEYVGQRHADALKLGAQLVFRLYPHGAMLCTVYGHAISLAIRDKSVRPSGASGTGDFYPNDSRAPLLFEDIAQPLAYILATNW